MSVQLKDGTVVEDPRLGRLHQFDERSRAYALADTLEASKPRSYTWRIRTPHLIDQGREGACTGFAVANELQARPSEVNLGTKPQADRFATELYWQAQQIDPWPGGAYPGADPRYGGTSVLAGVKVAQRLGYLTEYRWTFTLEDLVVGVGRHGPAVLGMTWWDSNYTPDGDGFIRPAGRKVGGHAILARAVKIIWRDGATWDRDGWAAVDRDRSYLTLRNSWGVWGHDGSGDCYVTLADMATWIDDRAEAVFFTGRTTTV